MYCEGAQKRYAAKAKKPYALSLHREKDKAMIEWLDAKDNKQAYLKGLIKNDMDKKEELGQ